MAEIVPNVKNPRLEDIILFKLLMRKNTKTCIVLSSPILKIKKKKKRAGRRKRMQ